MAHAGCSEYTVLDADNAVPTLFIFSYVNHVL